VKLKINNINKWWYIIVGLVVGYFIFLHFFAFSNVLSIEHDLVSWALPGKALIDNFGSLYQDFWNINPPGVILFTHLWMTVFGVSGFSFQLLHFLLVFVCLFGIIRIFRKIFPSYLFGWLSIITSIVLLSPRTLNMLGASELNGLAFSVFALNILIGSNLFLGLAKRGFFASFLFVLSSQMKDPFTFTIISLFPFLMFVYLRFKEEFKRVFKSILFGIASGASLIVGYLVINGSLRAYMQVLMVKRSTFIAGGVVRYLLNLNSGMQVPKESITYFPYSLWILFVLSFVFYLLLKFICGDYVFKAIKRRGKGLYKFVANLEVSEKGYEMAVLLFYGLGSWLGYSLQNRHGSHYDIQQVFPVIIFITIPLLIVYRVGFRKLKMINASKNLKKLCLFSFYCLVSLFTLPKIEYLQEFQYENISLKTFWNNMQKASHSSSGGLEDVIKKVTKPDDCIINLYGWAVGINYFYSQRRPCTRFFIPNMLSSEYIREYNEALVNNPPKAILYHRGGG